MRGRLQTRRQKNTKPTRNIYHSIQQNYKILPTGQTEARVTTVDIEDGKGVKGVMILHPSGKRTRNTKKLTKSQIQKITSNVFVPRLFSLKRTRSHKQRDAS